MTGSLSRRSLEVAQPWFAAFAYGLELRLVPDDADRVVPGVGKSEERFAADPAVPGEDFDLFRFPT